IMGTDTRFAYDIEDSLGTELEPGCAVWWGGIEAHISGATRDWPYDLTVSYRDDATGKIETEQVELVFHNEANVARPVSRSDDIIRVWQNDSYGAWERLSEPPTLPARPAAPATRAAHELSFFRGRRFLLLEELRRRARLQLPF